MVKGYGWDLGCSLFAFYIRLFQSPIFLNFQGLWYVGNIYLLEYTLVCFIGSITFNKYKSVIIYPQNPYNCVNEVVFFVSSAYNKNIIAKH